MTSPLAQAIAFQNSVSPAQSGIAPTDVIGAYKLASDVAERNYQAKIAQQNAMFGGLAGLGSAGLLAFSKPLSAKLFGTGATAAAAPAAADAALPAAAAPATGALDLGFSPFAAGAGGAGSVAADMGLGGSLAPAAGGVAADVGVPAIGSVASDLAAAAPAAGAADIGAATLPDWLLSFLPFLA